MPRKRSTSILLEGKHTTDDAWHDCEVSLTSTGQQTILNVRYPGLEDNEDKIFSANEARSRLRPRSKMLESGQCLQMQEGDIVLASRRSESGKIHFFDAQIEKVERQKHSARVACKCRFELTWLDGKMKGDLCTVSASQIHQINQCNIQDHPIIFEWLKFVKPEDGHQPEPSDIGSGSDVQAQLEEEIDKITLMADSLDKDYLAEELPATSLAESADVRQSSRRKAPARKRSATATLGSTAEAVNVRTSSRKGPQSIASSAAAALEDETILTVPSPFNKRPRLSPLAARAALAAAVQTMPLGNPSCGTPSVFLTKPLEKQTQRNAGKRLNTRSLVEDNESKISKSLSEIYTTTEEQEQGVRAIRRGAAKKRVSSRRSPAVSHRGPNFLSPIKESLLENQWEIPLEKRNVNKLITPSSDALDDNMLREKTNLSSKVGKQEHLATKETEEVAAKKARRKGEMSSLRSSARLRKETDTCASPLLESKKEIHSTAETTDNSTFQPKSEALQTDGGVSSGIIRTQKSTSIRSSRSKLSSQATSLIEGESGVDHIGLSQPKERKADSGITSADDNKVQDIKVIESKKQSSRKRQSMKTAHPNKKSKTGVHELSCSDTLQLKEENGQTTLRDELPMPAGRIDVTVELVTDIHNIGSVGENPSPHRLKLRTRKVSFDALPVGFGLGITGWLPSPGPLESQHSPPPCEVDPERGNTVDLHIEAADLMNTTMKIDGEKSKKTGRKKAAAIFYKTQGTGERLEATSKHRPAGASNVNENELLASDVGKKVMFASVLVQSSPCYGGNMHAFSSSEIKHQLGGEAMWSSSPACVHSGKKSANSILVSVFSGQNDPSESADSVAKVKRELGKRSKRSSASVPSIQGGEQGMEATHHHDGEETVRRSSGRLAKRTRKMSAV